MTRRLFRLMPRARGSSFAQTIRLPRPGPSGLIDPADCPPCPDTGCGVTITNSPPDGIAENFYEFQMEASGGTTPYTWSVTGDFPDDWVMDSTGYISGNESEFRTYTFTITVVDSADPACEVSQEFTIELTAT